jgi:hypothetical protein
MPELEAELRALGATIEFPPTPDLATAVRRRLAAERARRVFPLRRVLAVSLALVAVAVGAVMAVPDARTAVLEWLGLRGVKIERTETRATAPVQPVELGLGERTTLAEGPEQVGFPVATPDFDALGEPDEVYVSRAVRSGQLAYVWRDDRGDVELLLTQFAGSLSHDFIQKALGPRTTIEEVRVDGGLGFWIAGEPHDFVYLDERGEPAFDSFRLAGNTLVWERGDLTLRVEGDLTKEEALEIATAIR